MSAAVWHGQRGAVILGPTQHRVARYLEHATRHGRVTLKMSRVAGDLGLERSEAYRITRRLRVLGLFGIGNDRGHTNGGRRWWRTRDRRAADLNAGRHRRAWARVRAWCRALEARRLSLHARAGSAARVTRASAVGLPRPTLELPFGVLMRRAGLGDWLER